MPRSIFIVSNCGTRNIKSGLSCFFLFFYFKILLSRILLCIILLCQPCTDIYILLLQRTFLMISCKITMQSHGSLIAIESGRHGRNSDKSTFISYRSNQQIRFREGLFSWLKASLGYSCLFHSLWILLIGIIKTSFRIFRKSFNGF